MTLKKWRKDYDNLSIQDKKKILEEWKENPKVNPLSKKQIQKDKETYNFFLNKYEIVVLNKTKKTLDENISNKSKSGGANTNKNGLGNEREVRKQLSNSCDIIEKKVSYSIVKINGINDKSFKQVKNGKNFKKCMGGHIDKNVNDAHGCKEPDICYIDENEKIIYILEVKYQGKGGSVCEKLQTGVFKINHYSKLIPGYKISYIYILSPWFKENCTAEIEFLKENNIPIWWTTQKLELKDIINYK